MKLLQKKLSEFTYPQEMKDAGVYPYFRAVSSEQSSEVIINGKKILMFGSNSYLGLTDNKQVIEAAIDATRKYGTGCAGSRFLNGTLQIHEDLEKRIAKFVGKDEAIVFSTGFQVNLGVISCLLSRNDYIIYDELVHASIIEGRRLSYAKPFKFKHNDMDSLEKVLRRCPRERIKLIVVDSVFSMEGDVAKLNDIVALAEKYKAAIMVDEAHSMGVFGEHGEGLCKSLGLNDKIDLVMGTFSKSFASLGGFIATDSITANYIRHTARSFIFSASATPAAIGAANAALDIMQNEPERIKHLWDLTNYALDGFRKMGCEIGNTSTPIIPLFIRDVEKTFKVTTDLFNEGVFVNPVIAPAV
ncbi:MAG: pyridoxal phosphate-dependent aminotransferase family protein, partial [Bacteroidales bacterium]|nr:pyridoxal phosphate-dependent aminotransferase family protein [Bacteroidales bacterium]